MSIKRADRRLNRHSDDERQRWASMASTDGHLRALRRRRRRRRRCCCCCCCCAGSVAIVHAAASSSFVGRTQKFRAIKQQRRRRRRPTDGATPACIAVAGPKASLPSGTHRRLALSTSGATEPRPILGVEYYFIYNFFHHRIW